MNTAGNAQGATETLPLPPQLITAKAPGQAHAHVHGGIHPGPEVGPYPKIGMPKTFGPRLQASPDRTGAGKASGSAQRAQELPNRASLHASPDRARKAGNLAQAITSFAQGAQESQAVPEMDQAEIEVQDEF